MSLERAFSPSTEMRSYETLWAWPNQTVRTLAELFSDKPLLPSQVLDRWMVEHLYAKELLEKVSEFLSRLSVRFSLSLHRDFQYPRRLRAAEFPPELLYYRGDIGLIRSKSVSVVGARECSNDGKLRAAKMARGLVEAGYTVVSGLAKGIDTAAMKAAIEAGGHTIGVIGTPLNHYYPPENRDLQDLVGDSHLLVSHIPFYRYSHESWQAKRLHFPERNQTMAALSAATVVIEAGETSGSLIQARAAMKQGRKLFILNSCFESGKKWPHMYEKRGAIRVRDFDDVFSALGDSGNGRQAVEEN